MKNLFYVVVLILLSLFIPITHSCSYAPDEGVVVPDGGEGGGGGEGGNETKPTCTENVTYKNAIKPLLEKSCYSCHSNQSGQVNLTSEAVVDKLLRYNNASFMGNIKHIGRYPMPPVDSGIPKLTDCEIQQIEIYANSLPQLPEEPEPPHPCKVNITYSNHVAKIMTKYCVSCHYTGTTQPRVLPYDNYNAVSGKASKIIGTMMNGYMPPNSNSLPHDKKPTECEKLQFQGWIEAGKPN